MQLLSLPLVDISTFHHVISQQCIKYMMYIVFFDDDNTYSACLCTNYYKIYYLYSRNYGRQRKHIFRGYNIVLKYPMKQMNKI